MTQIVESLHFADRMSKTFTYSSLIFLVGVLFFIFFIALLIKYINKFIPQKVKKVSKKCIKIFFILISIFITFFALHGMFSHGAGLDANYFIACIVLFVPLFVAFSSYGIIYLFFKK